MAKLSLDHLQLNVTTLTEIIGRFEPAVLALPEVVDLIKVAISVFSADGKQTIEDLYNAKMAQTDKDHVDTQHVLSDRADDEAAGEPA